MSENDSFTLEIVRLFMVEKGGLCTNHDLVARFKPYLNNSVKKLENRTKLKEFVQLLAVVETRDGEKVLVLKKRYNEVGCFNMLPNQQQYTAEANQSSGGLVSIPETFNTADTPPEPLPPVRPSRARKKEADDVPSKMDVDTSSPARSFNTNPPVPSVEKNYTIPNSSSSLASSEMDFYSSLLGKKSSTDLDRSAYSTAPNVAPPVNKEPSVSESAPVLSRVDDNVPAALYTPAAVYVPAAPDVPVVTEVPATPDVFETADETDSRRTLKMQNSSEVGNKTPMSAKERIKQFDQISSDQSPTTTAPATSRRNNKENHRHTQHLNSSDEYDGMVSLDSKEKEWMLMSAAADYHAMHRLLSDHSDLAHRRDFINGNAMHWAAKHGKPEIIKMLNKYQVDATLKSYSGYTPLHLAAMGGQEECIELLVNLCKVQTNVRDFYGKRPKQYLRKNCSTRIQQMLLNNARLSFAVGNTVDDANAFARTQSFSAKIMKTTHGLARKFSSSRSSNDALIDKTDSASSPEQHTKFTHASDNRLMSQYALASDSGRGSLQSFNQNGNSSEMGSEESYAMSRSESTPNFPPAEQHDHSNVGYTNILQ